MTMGPLVSSLPLPRKLINQPIPFRSHFFPSHLVLSNLIFTYRPFLSHSHPFPLPLSSTQSSCYISRPISIPLPFLPPSPPMSFTSISLPLYSHAPSRPMPFTSISLPLYPPAITSHIIPFDPIPKTRSSIQ